MSQYLRSERPDPTEPVTFYIPGARAWTDPKLQLLRARRTHVTVDETHIFLVAEVDVEDGEQETL